MTRALAGIFVGGAGLRMGGVAKGLMRTAAGETLVERWATLLATRSLRVVLVGARADYTGLGIEVLADEPPGIGPLGGLIALLRRAGTTPALALACDMPFVSGALLDRLLDASPEAPIVAPRRDGLWEPLCARYDSTRVLETAVGLARTGKHSLQQLLEAAGAVELGLLAGEREELHDWDAPEDL